MGPGRRHQLTMIVPWREIAPETLDSLIEEYVTRDGTDYGEREVPLVERVNQVRRRLQSGEAVIWFEEADESINILSREQVPDSG